MQFVAAHRLSSLVPWPVVALAPERRPACGFDLPMRRMDDRFPRSVLDVAFALSNVGHPRGGMTHLDGGREFDFSEEYS